MAKKGYGHEKHAARDRALGRARISEAFRPSYYMSNPTDVRRQEMSVAERMNLRSKQLLGEYSRKNKPAAAPAVPKPKPKPAQVIRTTVSERTTPVKAAAPARMAVNRATGDTTGFTTGKTTGSTVTKSGTAYKTPETAYQRQQRISQEKSGVAGPSRSTGGANRSTGGASRSTGGRISDPSRGGMGNSGRGTGSKK